MCVSVVVVFVNIGWVVSGFVCTEYVSSSLQIEKLRLGKR